jgi:hypothetical protein
MICKKLWNWIHAIGSMEIKESFPQLCFKKYPPISFKLAFSLETANMKQSYWFSSEIHWTFRWACSTFIYTLIGIKICVFENGHVGNLFYGKVNRNLLIPLNVQTIFLSSVTAYMVKVIIMTKGSVFYLLFIWSFRSRTGICGICSEELS